MPLQAPPEPIFEVKEGSLEAVTGEGQGVQLLQLLVEIDEEEEGGREVAQEGRG